MRGACFTTGLQTMPYGMRSEEWSFPTLFARCVGYIQGTSEMGLNLAGVIGSHGLQGGHPLSEHLGPGYQR